MGPINQQPTPREAIASAAQTALPPGYIGYPMYAPMLPAGYGYCAADFMGSQQQPVQAIYYG